MDRISRFDGDPFGSFIQAQYQTHRASAEECAVIFGRLIINSALDGELTERLAERWGTNAGHYGRLALAERDAVATHVAYFADRAIAACGGAR